jgi:hypothetical protein
MHPDFSGSPFKMAGFCSGRIDILGGGFQSGFAESSRFKIINKRFRGFTGNFRTFGTWSVCKDSFLHRLHKDNQPFLLQSG